jgi:hypothetical protein
MEALHRYAVSRRALTLPRFVFALFSLAPLCFLAAQQPAEQAVKVTVTIDYGDGVQKHFTALPWTKGMTVLAAMESAQAHPRGIRFEFRGSGATAFLTKIDDLANEGKGRNWTYRVNDEQADKSFGVFELSKGDSVLWRFK